MKSYLQKRIVHFGNKKFLVPFCTAFGMLIVAFVINFYAGTYATNHASSSVTDLILDHLPVYNVNIFFVYGDVVFWIFLIGVWFHYMERVPFAVKTLSLFMVIRSIFITLTHIGPAVGAIAVESNFFVSKFSFGGDLFFSGHTGIPFLFALIFWDVPRLRYAFVVISLFFGAVVLLGHLHYSIDVLSAFFITYAIYDMAKLFFKKDLAFSRKDHVPVLGLKNS